MSRQWGKGYRSCAFIWARAGRVYFTQRDAQLIVLLVGGEVPHQQRDIKRAKALAALLD